MLADHLTAHSAAPRAPFESPEGFEEVWCVALGAKEDSTPAAFPPVPRLFGMTAIWHDEEALRAVSLEDGRPLWTLTFGVGDETSPRLPKPTAGDLSGLGGLGVDGLYFFVTREDRGPTGGDGELVAVDATDGRIIWRRAPSPRRPDGIRPRFDPDPVAIDGRIFVSSIEPGTPMRSWLQAFRVTDGKELWTLQVGSGMPLPWIGPGSRSLHDEDLVSAQPAAIAGGTLLLADSLGTLAAVDPQTGAVDWVYHYPRLQVPDDVRAVPRGFNREALRVSGDHLALAADDGAGLQFLYTRPQRLTAEGRFGVGLLCDSWPRDGLATLVDFDGRTALVSGPLLGEGMDLVRAFSPWSTERLEPWDQPMALARPIRGRCLRVGNEVYVSCAPIVYRLDGRVGAASKPLFSCPTSESKLTYGLTAVPGGLLLSNPRAVRFLRARAP